MLLLGLGATEDASFRREEVLEPVTNQVTTAPGNGRHNATYPDTGNPPACGNQTSCDGIRRIRHACPDSAAARLRCLQKPLRRIADSTQCHVDEPVRAAGGFAAAGCQCVILLGRWRVRVRHAGSILPVVVGFRAPGKRSGSSVGKVATSNGALWPAVVDVRDQRDVPYVRQPVAHRPDRLSRSAGVREDQHARPRAIAVRDAACRCCVHRASPPWTSHTRRIPLPPLSLPGLIARKALLRCCGFGLSAAIVSWPPGLWT